MQNALIILIKLIMMEPKAKSRGRQKIQMTRMSKESNLLVTFSKRRSGLFKKASELCTLCATDIAIIVFSPGKKAFSFGHPSVEAVVGRYLQETPPPAGKSTAMQQAEAHRIRNLNMHLNEVICMVETEKAHGEQLSRLREEGRRGGRWWESPVTEMKMEELEQLKAAMEDLRNKIFRQAEKTTVPLPPPPPLFFGEAGESSGIGQLSVTPQGFTLGFGSAFF